MNTSGDFQRILLALLQCKGSSSLKFNKERCKSDAEKLYKLGEGNWSENIELIYNIFTTRSPSDLSQILQYFKAKAGKGIMSAIAKEFSGNTYSLLSRIISSKIYSSQYFAESIHRIISPNLPNNNPKPNAQNIISGLNPMQQMMNMQMQNANANLCNNQLNESNSSLDTSFRGGTTYTTTYAQNVSGQSTSSDYLYLIILICSRQSKDLNEIKKIYQNLYKRSLIYDLDKITLSNEIKEVLKSIITKSKKI